MPTRRGVVPGGRQAISFPDFVDQIERHAFRAEPQRDEDSRDCDTAASNPNARFRLARAPLIEFADCIAERRAQRFGYPAVVPFGFAFHWIVLRSFLSRWQAIRASPES